MSAIVERVGCAGRPTTDPVRGWCSVSAPSRTAPVRSGNANRAPAPAATAGPASRGQRTRRGLARSVSAIGRPPALGVDARPLAERVLELLDAHGDGVRTRRASPAGLRRPPRSRRRRPTPSVRAHTMHRRSAGVAVARDVAQHAQQALSVR